MDLPVRRLFVDFSEPLAKHWCGGDAFKSAFFAALSMGFPVGEQYFIDSIRLGVATLGPAEGLAFEEKARGFIGQEATHRRLHALFNQRLGDLGLDNALERRAGQRMRSNAWRRPVVHVAATAATEHFTALLADWLLCRPDVFAGSEERVELLWMWHAAEESEHRSVAFDLMAKMSASRRVKMAIFRYVSITFVLDVARQTCWNLWKSGDFFKASTWRSGWGFLFSKNGLARASVGLWKKYSRRDFHPSQIDAKLSESWLVENADRFEVVGASPSVS
jgi:predicted metal-dependent hydrolase